MVQFRLWYIIGCDSRGYGKYRLCYSLCYGQSRLRQVLVVAVEVVVVEVVVSLGSGSIDCVAAPHKHPSNPRTV